MLTTNVNLRKGYGSIIRIFLDEAKPPYLSHRFYIPQNKTALESLADDWNTVTVNFSKVAQRKIEDVEAETCAR